MSDTAVAETVERAACMCGCNTTPKGKKARFLPGHDAQLKAALYRTIRSADTAEPERDAAVARLDELGWPQPAPKRSRPPKATSPNGETESVAADSAVSTADL